MADMKKYKSMVLYLISDASSYMTVSTVIVDGGGENVLVAWI